MKKEYASVEIEVINFRSEDIITSSTCPNQLPED